MTDVRQYLMQGPAAERYYEQTERKHFGASTGSGTGSEFRDSRAPDLLSLLVLAQAQRGSLDGNDHHVLGDPGRSGVYYLVVEVSGVNGALSARDLPPDSGLLVLRSKDGVPPDYLAFGVPRPATDLATLVMADERDESGQLTGKRVLLTCHPGLPMPIAGEHRAKHEDNTVLSREEISGDETVLIGDVGNLGEATVEAFEGLIGSPVATNEDVGRALALVASLPPDLRARAQGVLRQAWSIDDHYWEEEREVAMRVNSLSAGELRQAIADRRAAGGEASRVRVNSFAPTDFDPQVADRSRGGFR